MYFHMSSIQYSIGAPGECIVLFYGFHMSSHAFADEFLIVFSRGTIWVQGNSINPCEVHVFPYEPDEFHMAFPIWVLCIST